MDANAKERASTQTADREERERREQASSKERESMQTAYHTERKRLDQAGSHARLRQVQSQRCLRHKHGIMVFSS
jgi:superfamily II DNA or RNA helicase